ncbi:MAG: DUF45 domain-containing protein [Treponema sp.]|nr:DUF45 domain-containing protein [Treponema sp.]
MNVAVTEFDFTVRMIFPLYLSDNRVLVKAPFGTGESAVQEFLAEKKDWIKKQVVKQNVQNEKALELIT